MNTDPTRTASTNVVRRNSSEYSRSDGKSEQSEMVRSDVTKEQKSAGRSKVYGLLFTDPYALSGAIPTVIAGAVPVLTFLFMGNILNYLSQFALQGPDGTYDPVPDCRMQCIYMLIVSIVVAVLKFYSSLCWIRVGARISAKVREDVFTHIMQYDVAFYDTHSIGSLLTILGEDSAIIQECFGATKGLQLQQFGQFFIGWLLLIIYSWRLGLIMLCIIPVCVTIMLTFHPWVELNGQTRFKYMSNSITIAEETISAIRTVRGYNREEKEYERFSYQAERASHYERNIIFLIGSMFFCVMVIVWGVVIGLFYYSSTFCGEEENGRTFNPGTMISCFGYSMMGCMGVVALENSIQAEQRAHTAAGRIIVLTSYQPSINFNGGIIPENFKGHIEFRNCTFSYPTRKAVKALNNVSFEVMPGETIALVGHSGSGKSTSIQILERYYDVDDGIVLLDGQNIQEIDPHWLHQKMALVSQEPTLFQASVKENIIYGIHDKESVTDDQVWQALEMANAKKFVSKFDNQLDQLVGDRGSTVSGGQRQRIAIARAVIKDPVVLLCDEATSALDSESEKKVQIALDKILETRTGVIVAHRLTTIRNAKRIYVFDAGKIVEVGNHDELIAKGGAYYNLVKRQLQKEEAENAGKKPEEKKKEKSESSSSSSKSDKKKPEEVKPQPEEKKEEKSDSKKEKVEEKPEEKTEEKPKKEKKKGSDSSDSGSSLSESDDGGDVSSLSDQEDDKSSSSSSSSSSSKK